MYLIDMKANKTIKNTPDEIILFDAIVNGDDVFVKRYCNGNVDINIRGKKGKSPLHFAAMYGRMEITKILLASGAFVDLEDENGNTPLSDAVFNSKGNTEIIKLLLDNGANFNKSNHYGVSPKDLSESISNFDVSYLFQE